MVRQFRIQYTVAVIASSRAIRFASDRRWCNTLPHEHSIAHHLSSSLFSFFLVSTPSPPTPFRHRINASFNNGNISPLAAVAPLHSLAQLVPSSTPVTGPTESGREDEGKYILLTSLKLDTWLVHVGRPDGRWRKDA